MGIKKAACVLLILASPVFASNSTSPNEDFVAAMRLLEIMEIRYKKECNGEKTIPFRSEENEKKYALYKKEMTLGKKIFGEPNSKQNRK